MSFLDELKIAEEFGRFRFCEWIEINDEYCLSIQCGEGKYCDTDYEVEVKTEEMKLTIIEK